MPARATGGSLTGAIAALLRPEEERFLEAALGAVESRRSVVELIGEPGSGKTRLLGAFCELAAERGWAVLRSSGGADGEPGVRCQMFVEALRSRLADRTAEENREPVAQLMRNLATGPFPATGGASSLEDGRCQTFSAMSGMLSDWAGARGGLVIVLDDVHAADQGSLELLEYLVRWPTEQPIALVIAHRPAQSPAGLRALLAEGADYGTSVSVELGPLNLAQAARLTGHPAGSDALRILHHMSDGVPLYLLTLDRWRSEHVGRFSGDGWLTEGSALPVAFTARIRGELASLDAEERAVALAAVMLGTTFDLGGVSIASGLPERTVCRVLEQLRRPDLIRDAPNGGFHFRHPLLRRVVYEESDACGRLGAHRRALAVLVARGAPAGVLALHIERSVPGSAVGDLDILLAAARESLRAGDLSTAADRLDTSIRLLTVEARDEASAPYRSEPADRARRAAELLLLTEDLTARTGVRGQRDQATELVHRLVPGSPPRNRAVAAPPAVRGPAEPPAAALTERERQVAEIAATGKRTREIAAELTLSPRTVDVHLSRIYRKLGVGSRAALARLVAETGLGRPDGQAG
ncbi:AAA family ATPase [Streptomyces sp. NPDC091265]|uniref:helix-turn-helix transcriptional regulator n=1 Tax=unclassified Streptomyces TaxID=2593676 RepID=UPI00344F5077